MLLSAGVFFVPAFSGLLAPYWRSDARGVILGLSSYSSRGHIVRALLEAIAWQVTPLIATPVIPLSIEEQRCMRLPKPDSLRPCHSRPRSISDTGA